MGHSSEVVSQSGGCVVGSFFEALEVFVLQRWRLCVDVGADVESWDTLVQCVELEAYDGILCWRPLC